MEPLDRCNWCGADKLYQLYHDMEWGVPVYDDRVFFEFLILEGAQAGLSWITILRKREGYKQAFANFDVDQVARFSDEQLTSLLIEPSIIRNRLKVFSARSNAQAFMKIQAEFGSFSDYIWGFVGGTPIQNERASMSSVPATTVESDIISKDLKKRGFKFVGSTIVYAFMQATGMVNDHVITCYRYQQLC